MTIVSSVQILDGGYAVAVGFSNNETYRFHAVWLRDNAQDAETRDATNGQRLIRLSDIPNDLRIETASADGGLTVDFGPTLLSVTFDADWLLANAYDHEVETRNGWIASDIELFDGTLNPRKVTAEFSDLESSPKALAHWLSQIKRFGFACVSGGPAEQGAILKLIEKFGYVRETNYGKIFEVRTEVNPTNLAYTGLGLQAHTDNPYRDPVPTIQVLYCLENSAEGGENQVIDGFSAAKWLQSENPEGFELLASHPITFEYNGQGGVHLKSKKPMIELGADGELIGVRFNNRSAAAITNVPYADMQLFYDAYRQFGQMIDDPSLSVEFKLAPGDAFVVDNTRVLHARSAYAATGGSRWLQGAYADKDGLMSNLSALERTC